MKSMMGCGMAGRPRAGVSRLMALPFASSSSRAQRRTVPQVTSRRLSVTSWRPKARSSMAALAMRLRWRSVSRCFWAGVSISTAAASCSRSVSLARRCLVSDQIAVINRWRRVSRVSTGGVGGLVKGLEGSGSDCCAHLSPEWLRQSQSAACEAGGDRPVVVIVIVIDFHPVELVAGNVIRENINASEILL